MDQSRSNLLYIFDEPTVGLHYHHIKFLVKAFDELIARGSSLLVIEHNLDVIRTADYVIDLGPDGGSTGGEVLYSGTLSGILDVKSSYTGQYLKKSSITLNKQRS